MRTYLLSIILLIAVAYNAAGQTVHDFKTAKALALDQNKLIILDFWAVWCGPCKIMDSKLWNTAEFSTLTDRFVLLKINIDSNRAMALKYNVRGIPRVFVITANEDKIWDEQGFRDARPYLNILSSFPKDYTVLNEGLLQIFNKKKANPEDLFRIGEALRELALQTTNGRVKDAFFSLSNSYFKKTQKNTDSKILEMESLVSQILNDAYNGNHKKAMKKLKKLNIKDDMGAVKELKNFVMAYCYKCEGNLEKMEAIKKEIKDKELLSRLN